MPSLARRPCTYPGCHELAEEHGGSLCTSHRIARYRQNDARRPTSTARGYDAGHRRLRVLCFQRDLWRCCDCGWEPTIVKDFRELDLGAPPRDKVLDELRVRFNRGERHLQADHVIPIEQRPDLRLDLDNLKTRCSICHSARTMRESAINPFRIPVRERCV